MRDARPPDPDNFVSDHGRDEYRPRDKDFVVEHLTTAAIALNPVRANQSPLIVPPVRMTLKIAGG